MAYRGTAFHYKVRVIGKTHHGEIYGITLPREIAMKLQDTCLAPVISGDRLIFVSGTKKHFEDEKSERKKEQLWY